MVHVIAKDIIIDPEILYCYRNFEYGQKIRKRMLEISWEFFMNGY
jgi:hypothetical protein